MDLKERAYSVLVVSAAEKFNISLQKLFPCFRYSPVRLEASISAAKRAAAEREYDFIVINSPLPDDDGLRFSMDICAGKSAVVLLLIRSELYASVFDQVSPYGVYTLSKPLSRQTLGRGLDWMASTRERLRKLEKKTLSLEDKMQEIRIVNRAKWLLITELKMTETDAHYFIERQAMDRCVTKREVAEGIIQTYL